MILLDTSNFPFSASESYHIDRDYKILTDYHGKNPLLGCADEYLTLTKHLNYGYMILRHSVIPHELGTLYKL